MEDIVFIRDFLARLVAVRVCAGFCAVADFHFLGQRQLVLCFKDLPKFALYP